MTTGSEHVGNDAEDQGGDNRKPHESGHGDGHSGTPRNTTNCSEAEIRGSAKTHLLRGDLRVIDGGKSSGMPAADDESLEARIQHTLIWAAEQASEYYLKTLGRQPTDAERRDYACEITAIAHGRECAALINEPPGAA